MFDTRSFTASPPGGRPSATSHHSPLRTAALLPHVVWIPGVLTILLMFAFLRSWHFLKPRWTNLLLSDDRLTKMGRAAEAFVSSTSSSSDTHGKNISPVFTPQVQYWAGDISRWADDYGLDPNLVALVMQIESCGHPRVKSPAGAMGLFQVMPFHFRPDEDPLDPQTNALRGLSYLARSMELSGGRIDLALAGYNGGHGLIHRNPETWPTETQRYVRWGVGILEDLRQVKTTSVSLDKWLAAGGANLCRKASQTLGD